MVAVTNTNTANRLEGDRDQLPRRTGSSGRSPTDGVASLAQVSSVATLASTASAPSASAAAATASAATARATSRKDETRQAQPKSKAKSNTPIAPSSAKPAVAAAPKRKSKGFKGLRIAVPRRPESRRSRVSAGNRLSASSRSSMGDNRRSYGTRQSTDWESIKTQKRRKTQQVTALVCKHRFWKRLNSTDHLRAVFAIDFFPWDLSSDLDSTSEPNAFRGLENVYSLFAEESKGSFAGNSGISANNNSNNTTGGQHNAFAKPWVPDCASSRCQLCMAAFHLTRRRHHCRLCGTLVCSTCSSFRTFIPDRAPWKPVSGKAVDVFGTPEMPQGLMSTKPGKKSNSKQFFAKKPLRTCGSCCGTLKKMADQDDPRVIHINLEDPDDPSRPSNLTASCLSMTPSSRKKARTRELRQVLDARTFSKGRSASPQFVIHFEWLQQWRLYIDIDQQEKALAKQQGGEEGNASSRRCALPRPGPISNFALLEFRNGRLVPRNSLQKGVDYQVLSQEMWQVLVRLYGGGPSIQVMSQNQSQNGTVAVGHWDIRQEDEPLAKPAPPRPSHHRSKRSNQQPLPHSTAANRTYWHAVSSSSSSSLAQTASSSMPSPMHLRPMHTNRPANVNVNVNVNVIANVTANAACIPTRRNVEKPKRTVLPPQPELRFSKLAHAHPVYGYDSRAVQVRTSVATCGFSKNQLFDNSKSCDDDELFDSDEQTPVTYRETLAAVTAFATAAMEARKKSAMSLSRHSCVSDSRLSSSSAYTFTA